MPDFDVVIIGSGFGGSITACRLAEAGYRVLLLERGRRWDVKDYPRRPGDAWVWDQNSPAQCNGWLDLRLFPNIGVALGAGVGGGSLIYANVSIEATPDLFEEGWPPEITYQELQPYYARVGKMLNVQTVPRDQWSERAKLVQEAADQAGYGPNFLRLDLAVEFDRDWKYNPQDPPSANNSQKIEKEIAPNLKIEQGTCAHLGNCVIGCDVKAKSTLDLNYIPLAEKHGAQVRALHIARSIAPETGGYRVCYDRILQGALKPESVTCRVVIVAAGSLGSTELLLRCRDEFRTLPQLSRKALGRDWSANGDFLTPALYRSRSIFPSRGPTISVAIDFRGSRNLNGEHFLIEDGGFPDFLRNWIEAKEKDSIGDKRHAQLLRSFESVFQRNAGLDALMPWFGMGRDAANGHLSLRRKWWLGGEKTLHLDWPRQQSKKIIRAIIDMHKKLSEKTGGSALVPPARYVVSPHPLGGCNMGTTADNGVVDHKGEVFGYRNLFVADGAIVPEAIGANPSKTIGALAERIAEHIIQEGR